MNKRTQHIILLLCLSTATAYAEPPSPSLDLNGHYKVPQKPESTFDPTQKNPYSGQPIEQLSRIAVQFDQQVEIPVPIGGITIIRLKTPKGVPIAPDAVYCSRNDLLQVQVMDTPNKAIIITCISQDPISPKEDQKSSVLDDGYLFIETTKGTLNIHVVINNQRQPGNTELVMTRWDDTTQQIPTGSYICPPTKEPERFNYELNPPPKNPLNGPKGSQTYPTDRGYNIPIGNTDLGSKSPEARTYNPYGQDGNQALAYYNPSECNAPQISTELLPTAILMMRNYDHQRQLGITTDNDVKRKIIGKRFNMTDQQEIFLSEAFRFPKYQSTVLRIVWNNNTSKSHYLNPEKIGLKMGKFIFTAQVFAQTRHIVFPAQNNEMFLVYRTPDADLEQEYELILPRGTQNNHTAGPQPLPQPNQ